MYSAAQCVICPEKGGRSNFLDHSSSKLGNTLEIGYSDSVLSASAVLIHARASRLRASRALRHNFILIYVRVFRDISIIRLGEPI